MKNTHSQNPVKVRKRLLFVTALAVAIGTPLSSFANPTVSLLSPSVASPQPVGTPVIWTATASDTAAGTLMYSFSVGRLGGTLSLVRDFSPNDDFLQYPALQEGILQIQVTVRNSTTLETGTAVQTFVATAIASSGRPVVVSNTPNPLVALFSAAPCPTTETMVVAFKSAAQTSPQLTPAKACDGKSMNFYIAGMHANTQYSMTGAYLVSGTVEGYTSTVNYTTGNIPTTVQFPAISVLTPAPAVAASEPILIHSYLSTEYVQTGTDLSGNVVWYYEPWDGQGGYLTRAQNGGYFWLLGGANFTQNQYAQALRLFDVAGNTVAETNVGRINEQLVALGQQPLTDVDHEIRTLSNGDILMVGSLDNILGPNIQGGADIVYNELVVLNPGLQVTWTWNSVTCGNCATKLPPTRAAILGETCVQEQAGCPPITPPNTIANDWLHGNAAELAPDGSILMSLRHQDWIIKIDYNNGAGTGNILWRLGLDGDFSIVGDPGDTYPWFSHQHDPEWDFGSSYLSVFDNGNTRVSENPGEFSRGQLLDINQSTMTATLLYNVSIGSYCMALGTAQVLINEAGTVTGMHFECGTTGPGVSQSQSFYSTGTLNLQSAIMTYRSAQMHDMYSPYVGTN